MAAATDLETVGKPILKPDAWTKATGMAVYAGDVRVAGALEARVLRSPHPHARIVSIDTSAAEALSGVYAVVTGRDVARPTGDHHAIASDKVIFVGEAVAAVAALDEETAERAIGLIRVEYDPLPAVLDPEEAVRADAPLIHEHATGESLEGAQGNIRSRLVHETGDVERALQEPGVVIHEATYHTPRQSPGYTEPHAAVAQVDSVGKVTISASTKAPFRARVAVANALGIPISQVRLVAPLIGGDFGGKGGGFVEPIVALLARKARRPVRLVLSRSEEFAAMISRPGYAIRIKMGARPDGTIVALEGEQICDLGAVDDFGPGRAARNAALAGAYRIPNLRVAATAVYTNTSPAGHVRAPSGPQNAFALESHLNSLAGKLGIDPLQLRLKNILHNGELVPAGVGVLRNSGLDECIARARSWLAQANTPKEPGRGIGLALGAWSLGPKVLTGETAATVRIDVDGSVIILTGIPDQGAGQWSVVAQVASEVLGVPMDRVNVVAADTEATPYETGVGGSNVTYRVGNSVRQAAEDARQKLLNLAAQRLEVDAEELVIKDGQICLRADSNRRISVAQVARSAGTSAMGTIIGTSAPVREREVQAHGREQMETVDSPSLSCHVAQIQVDPETGIVEVQRYFAAQDVGRAINPLAAKGQIEGGVVFGLGYALSEEIITQNGTNVNANLWEYLLPTAPHVPDLTIELVEVPSTFGPFGAKGIGENPAIPVAAAIANAVEDALGVRVTRAPLTPERILAALRERSRLSL